jgi:DNA-binding CsgD family transcriptional regulator
MRLGRRYGLSTAQKTKIWRRWKEGESLHEIGRALGKDHGWIHFLLSQHRGIVPAVRRRSERTPTLAEREEISRGIASGSSIREIARDLQRSASTVSREERGIRLDAFPSSRPNPKPGTTLNSRLLQQTCGTPRCLEPPSPCASLAADQRRQGILCKHLPAYCLTQCGFENGVVYSIVRADKPRSNISA